tara:strand:+ start:332 stop:1462 length:1131 start_codon:yes stop_codon:yes gene_type:complete
MIFPCFEDVLCVDYNLTADLRYRLKTDTSEDIEKDAFSSLSEMRSRIGINLFTENVSGHFILQDSRMLGDLDNSSGVTGSTAKTFFHQTYFIYKNKNQSFKFGRFELALGNQRIIAKNNWNNIGRSFEGILFKRENRFGERLLFYFPIVESIETEHDDRKDNILSGLYWKVNLSIFNEKSILEPYIINLQHQEESLSYSMYGLRTGLNTKLISIESELTLQSGSSISSYLASFNLGYKPKNLEWFKNITIGTELISADDSKTNKLEGFSKYFGARHKHHGYYDYKMHKKYFGHNHDGLMEFNLKGNFNLFEKNNLLIAIHNFNNYDNSIQYGNELDIVLKRSINKNLSSELGIIFYQPEIENKTLNFFYFMMTTTI